MMITLQLRALMLITPGVALLAITEARKVADLGPAASPAPVYELVSAAVLTAPGAEAASKENRRLVSLLKVRQHVACAQRVAWPLLHMTSDARRPSHAHSAPPGRRSAYTVVFNCHTTGLERQVTRIRQLRQLRHVSAARPPRFSAPLLTTYPH